MKPIRSIAAAISLLIAAGVYLYLNEYCGDCRSGAGNAPVATPGAAGGSGKTAPVPPATPPAAFDYYLLSLSWSPTFCESESGARDRTQCGGRGFAFVVHGLWPQNEKGYPKDCPTDMPRVPEELIQTLLDIMPSRGLIGHEWRSHGACTGMSQEDYFAQVRAAFEAVVIPQAFQAPAQTASVNPGDIARAFLDANKGKLEANQLVVTCGGAQLDEVRLCMTKNLQFRACSAQTLAARCRRDQVQMPPVRGG